MGTDKRTGVSSVGSVGRPALLHLNLHGEIRFGVQN